MQKLSKKFLEKFSEEELSTKEKEIILEYQKKFSLFFDKEGNLSFHKDVKGKFLIDARTLYTTLGSNHQFSKWIDDYIQDYVEGEDYCTQIFQNGVISSIGEIAYGEYSVQRRNLLGITKEYFLTLDFAKEICMMSGRHKNSSKELKENGKLCRQYFLLMEKLTYLFQSWFRERSSSKVSNLAMNVAIDKHYARLDKTNAFQYSNEADMLNLLLFGKKSKELKAEIGIEDTDLLRDYLDEQTNGLITYVQQTNTSLLDLDFPFEQRKEYIAKLVAKKRGE